MTALKRLVLILAVVTAVCVTLLLTIPGNPQQDETIVERFRQITGDSEWELVGTIPISFDAHHPQGMTLVGDFVFFSSVQVTTRTETYEQQVGGYDRTAGEGLGHLFKVDRGGNIVASITLGEDSIYHPGGIDFDGSFIWVPVAEYRPNSSSIVYRVDPATMEAAEVFRFGDHLGGLVLDTADATLHGVSWGSRFFYSWRLNEDLEISTDRLDAEEQRVPNANFYIDYQDCQYAATHHMLCSGVKRHHVRSAGDSVSHEFTLGGLDLVDLQTKQAVHQIPFNWMVGDETAMTTNPFFVEPTDNHLRFYFMPEDNESTIFLFDVTSR